MSTPSSPTLTPRYPVGSDVCLTITESEHLDTHYGDTYMVAAVETDKRGALRYTLRGWPSFHRFYEWELEAD